MNKVIVGLFLAAMISVSAQAKEKSRKPNQAGTGNVGANKVLNQKDAELMCAHVVEALLSAGYLNELNVSQIKKLQAEYSKNPTESLKSELENQLTINAKRVLESIDVCEKTATGKM